MVFAEFVKKTSVFPAMPDNKIDVPTLENCLSRSENYKYRFYSRVKPILVGVKLIFLRVKALLIVFSVEWMGIKCGLIEYRMWSLPI